VTYLVKADKIAKENTEIKIHLARNYLTLNKPILAEKTLKQVLEINPNHKAAKDLFKQCA
jgi:Tfp pilus assembly protein PilF